VAGQPHNDRIPGHTVVQFGPRYCIEFWGATEAQERIGWSEALNSLRRNPVYSDELRVALIVDAYLGSLAKINAGEEALVADVYLPSNMRMIYASSDSPNESIANKMLSLADKESKRLLDRILTKKPAQNPCSVQGKPYSHIRFWNL